MATNCGACGTKLGLGARLSGTKVCGDCERSAKAAAAAQAAKRDASIERVRAVLTQVIADEHLSEADEKMLDDTARAEAMDDETYVAAVQPYAKQIMIARLNSGRLPAIAHPSILMKPGEVAHFEVEALLMKEVVHRRMEGGYSGVSFRIAKGVSYRVGGYRGRSVVVGTSIEVADRGPMVITSRRAVFKGQRQNMEADYRRLIGLNVFDDGVQFHLSNRKTAPLFKVADGHLVAAAVNAVAQAA